MNAPLDTFVINADTPCSHCFIWMHGLGATAHDFEGIVPLLQLPEGCNTRFIFPQAPTQPVTINGGMAMPSWYDIYHLDRLEHQDRQGVEASQEAINAIIDLTIEQGIASENIILAGFSQGGAMALHTGLRYPKPLAGIMAMSCYLPLSDLVESEKHSNNHNTPIFMAHGSFDPVLPYVVSELSTAELKHHGYDVSAHQYPMAHEICTEEIKDMSAWLCGVLKPPAGTASPR